MGLLRRSAQAGPLADPQDFARFYRRHSEQLLVFFTRRVFEPELALDLTAETFAQAFLSRRRFRGESEAEAVGWLYGIARHQLSRFVRRGRAERRALAKLGVEVPELTPEDQERVEELASLSELRAAVSEGLAELSEAQREALQLRVVRELSYPEVAERLGCSEQTARARVSRGLRSLAERIDASPELQESSP